MLNISILSPAELEIMEFIWRQNKKVLSKEILEHFNIESSKGWKKQTLNTFLVKLYQKGLINRISEDRKYYYEPKITKEQYQKYISEDFIRSSYGGSFLKFISSLIGTSIITNEEINEIKKLLKERE